MASSSGSGSSGSGSGGGDRRYPNNLEGLLAFCTEQTRAEDAQGSNQEPISEEKERSKSGSRSSSSGSNMISIDAARRNQDKALTTLGLYRYKVAGDGNCLFRSVASQLRLDQEKYHSILRQAAAKWMAQHSEELLAAGLLDDTREIVDTSQANHWPGQAAVVALANMLNVNIAIIQGGDQGNIDIQHISPLDVQPGGEQTGIMLAYLYNGHYDGVVHEPHLPNPDYALWSAQRQADQEDSEILAQKLAEESGMPYGVYSHTQQEKEPFRKTGNVVKATTSVPEKHTVELKPVPAYQNNQGLVVNLNQNSVSGRAPQHYTVSQNEPTVSRTRGHSEVPVKDLGRMKLTDQVQNTDRVPKKLVVKLPPVPAPKPVERTPQALSPKVRVIPVNFVPKNVKKSKEPPPRPPPPSSHKFSRSNVAREIPIELTSELFWDGDKSRKAGARKDYPEPLPVRVSDDVTWLDHRKLNGRRYRGSSSKWPSLREEDFFFGDIDDFLTSDFMTPFRRGPTTSRFEQLLERDLI